MAGPRAALVIATVDGLTRSLGALTAPLAMLVGAANCFLGYRLFRLMLALYGLLWGGAFGVALAGGSGLSEGGALALVLVSAALGAWLALAWYFVGVFLVGASAGALLASTVGVALGVDVPAITTLGVALLVGVLALKLQRVVIILSTAFSGAWIMLVTLGALTRRGAAHLDFIDASTLAPIWPQLDASRMAVLLLWLGLGTVGAVVQLSSRSR